MGLLAGETCSIDTRCRVPNAESVLPLSDISALSASVDPERRSPVADAAAAQWGYPPGAARFWRSSARHVFAVHTELTRLPSGYLRLAPASRVPLAETLAVAEAMATLADRGLASAPAVWSTSGRLVETVSTTIGPLHATVVAAAAGDHLDADDLVESQANEWGAALARLHRDGDGAGPALPDGRARTDRELAGLASDPGVAVAVARLRSWLGDQTVDGYGLVHGDFELDNLAWCDGKPTCFDFDEAEHGWFVADIAFAVRDLLPDPRVLADRAPPLLEAFLDGYRVELPTAVISRPQLLGFTAVNTLRLLARLRPLLSEPPGVGADLLAGRAGVRPLRVVIEEHAQRYRLLATDLASLVH